MVHLDDQGRPEPPLEGDEAATLLGFLDFQRATLEWKCAGLDDNGFNATVGVSTMTLGGLLKHMALVEAGWFSRSLHGHDREPPWDAVAWDADPDWEWRTAADDTPDYLRTLWAESIERSRELTAEAMADGGLDTLARPWPDGRAPNLRWIVVHMIEECARSRRPAARVRGRLDGGVVRPGSSASSHLKTHAPSEFAGDHGLRMQRGEPGSA